MEGGSAIEAAKSFLAAPTKHEVSEQNLRNLNQQAWSETAESSESLESILMKAIKKAPEGFAKHADSLLKCLPASIVLDGMVDGGIVPLALRMMRSNLLDVRNAAISIASRVQSRLSSPRVRATVLQTVCDGLRPKSAATTAMTQPDHKVALILCLLRVYGDLVVSSVPDLLLSHTQVMEDVVFVAQKEEESGMSLLLGRLLGGVLSVILQSIGAESDASRQAVANTLSACLTSVKSATRLCGHVAVSCALCQHGADTVLQLLSDSAVTSLVEASSKSSSDVEHVVSAGVLALLSAGAKPKKAVQQASDQCRSRVLSDSFKLPLEKLRGLLNAQDALQSGRVVEDLSPHLAGSLVMREQALSTLRQFAASAGGEEAWSKSDGAAQLLAWS
ncbi:hypothetical protein EON64_04480, partial [archaeon]